MRFSRCFSFSFNLSGLSLAGPLVHHSLPQTAVSFSEMKGALHNQPTLAEREQEEKARKVMQEKFQTATFSELCSITLANKPAESLYHCLSDIYGKSSYDGSVSRKSSLSVDTTDILSPSKAQKPLYEEYFPELFMY